MIYRIFSPCLKNKSMILKGLKVESAASPSLKKLKEPELISRNRPITAVCVCVGVCMRVCKRGHVCSGRVSRTTNRFLIMVLTHIDQDWYFTDTHLLSRTHTYTHTPTHTHRAVTVTEIDQDSGLYCLQWLKVVLIPVSFWRSLSLILKPKWNKSVIIWGSTEPHPDVLLQKVLVS